VAGKIGAASFVVSWGLIFCATWQYLSVTSDSSIISEVELNLMLLRVENHSTYKSCVMYWTIIKPLQEEARADERLKAEKLSTSAAISVAEGELHENF
jgi:hypothetical protein